MTKASAGDGRQKYIVLQNDDRHLEGKYIRVLQDAFLSMDMAQNILDSQKLELDIHVEEEYNSDYSKGNVFRTVPASGEQLKTGQKVTLYLSKGPELKKVPNVVGMDIEKAMDVLKKVRFDMVFSFILL